MANRPTDKFPAFITSVSVALTTAADGLSEVSDLVGGSLAALEMPAGWTDAVITFKGGRTSSELFDLYGSTGDEVTITTTASRMVAIDPVLFAGIRYWQLRSGTGAAAVAQAAARTLKLHVIG